MIVESAEPNPGWEAIATAPQNGSRLLLWSKEDGVNLGHWSTSAWTNAGAWIVYESRGDTIELHPTHWMPLPLPPNHLLEHGTTKHYLILKKLRCPLLRRLCGLS